jgi:hypothetical protein
VIDSSLRSARSSYNTEKLRQTGIVRRQGRLRLRQFKRGVRQRLRLGYQGRRRKLIELVNRPPWQLLAGLVNDLNKLSKSPKEYEAQPQGFCKSYHEKESCCKAYSWWKASGCCCRCTTFSHDAAEQSTLQGDICSVVCYSTPLYLFTKKNRNNSCCVRFCSLKL